MTEALRCYVCGKTTGAKVGDRLMLVAMATQVDRVFIMHEDCIDQVDRRDRVVALTVLVIVR